VGNIEIAFGDGRLFLIDGTSKADLVRAKRRNDTLKAELTLVALDLSTGAELWRQDDVPLLGDRSDPSRLQTNITHLFMGLPNWGHLVYAEGVVLYGANAAYDAATGKTLWQRAGQPGKLPVVYGDRIITSENAYQLRTGKPCTAEDLLTGQRVPWRYSRAYGCGPVAGCQHLLFFRSGADGFFDMETEGTTNFGGERPGCARTLLAANGLLIHPQGYSGCCCSYNYQTNLALVSARDRGDTWYALPRLAASGPIRNLAVNFGAPGDRKDRRKTAWLGFPRPLLDTACPAPVAISMRDSQCVHRRRATATIQGTSDPWIYSSALVGRGRITLDLVLRPGVVLPRRDGSCTIDGKLDETCWNVAQSVPFQNSPFSMLGAAVDLRMFRDAENIYFGYDCRSAAGGRRDANQEPRRAGDALEIFVADAAKDVGIRLVIPRRGKPAATFGTVASNRKVDPAWKGPWRSAVRETAEGWTAEVALPIKTLAESGMDAGRLRLNGMAQNWTPSGFESVFLTDPRYGTKFASCLGFLRILEDAEPPKPRRFTVRLHFAELDDPQPGRRVFDVALQGKTVLDNLDILREAGGKDRALVKEFRDVEASDQIVIDLTPHRQPGDGGLPPLISGIEVAETP
jgi:hypothetical protein